MRNWLHTLDSQILLKIALDLGIGGNCTRSGAIAFIVEQAKSYRWNAEDLKARYQI